MWDWAVWGTLAAAAVAGGAAGILLFMRVRAVFRTLEDVRRHTAESLGDLAAKGELTALKAEAAGDTAELQESVARLRVSLAQLTVLKAALEDVEDKTAWVTALIALA